MNLSKKLSALILSLVFVLSLTGCMASREDDEKKKKDERVLNAIEELKDYWKNYYDEKGIKDTYLEITNTQIINIKDELTVDEKYKERAESLFGEIDYIVEFGLLSNALDFHSENSSEFYFNYLINNCIVVYKDGKIEVAETHLLNAYRSMTYSTDFSGIIESIENVHGEYDQVIKLD